MENNHVFIHIHMLLCCSFLLRLSTYILHNEYPTYYVRVEILDRFDSKLSCSSV